MKPAHPFVKWAGGKAQLVGTLAAILPGQIRTFFEPFVGGGALFFTLAEQGRFQRAVLNDWNAELVDAYKVIRDFPEELIGRLKTEKKRYLANPQETFYEVRAKNPQSMEPIERVVRFLFLNRTGFNGLYRVNKKGEFNVPWGKYKNPRICNEENIRACSEVLKRFVILECADFATVVERAEPGDAVYFDPPYVPLNATSNFTSYTSDGFTLDDQHRLAISFRELAEAGVAVVASNSDTEVVRELYKGFEMYQVEMRRNVNSKGDRRGPVHELVIVGRRGSLSASIPPSLNGGPISSR